MRWLPLLVLFGCGGDPAAPAAPAANGGTHPVIVLGFDGMDWGSVDELQAQGQLPNIKAFREKAAQAKLGTDYDARSPIVWTTMATGVDMDDHGVTDFATSTEKGLVAMSSAVRKVPAIWNMVSKADKKVAVVGLWATFPAEDVNGVILSDKAGTKEKGRIVSPDSYRATFDVEIEKAHADRSLFPTDEYIGPNDRMAAHFTPILEKEGYDLIWSYLRGIDVVSHEYWKYWRPGDFMVDPAELEKYKDVIPQKYRAMDTVIGAAVAAAPPDANIFILSDHGFESMKPELVMVSLDFYAVLEHVGVLTADEKGTPDFAKSTVYGYQAQNHRSTKYLRVAMAGREEGGKVPAAKLPEIRAKLTERLGKFTWADGTSKVFSVRDLKDKEKADVGVGGADFAVDVILVNAGGVVLDGGKELPGVVKNVTGRSGYHRKNPPGVFMARGPDIDPAANLDGIRIHDITPTLLYALGLPVAEDFDGVTRTQLFTKEFQGAHALQKIPTYGKSGATSGTVEASDNEATMEQLKKLGYLDEEEKK
jgi:predicted AlkP superfamily phosphohydrolase/phosphomutase